MSDYSEYSTQAGNVFRIMQNYASLGRWQEARTHCQELKILVKDIDKALQAHQDKMTAIRYAQKGIKAEVHTDHAGRTWVETP